MLLTRLGKAPGGERLKRIQLSVNFVEGKFVNKTFTPQLSEGFTFWEVLYKCLLKRNPEARPKVSLPAIKTDLKDLSIEKDVLIWFGHSSYYFQVNGVRFLVDPVLSQKVAPFGLSLHPFPGTDIYSADDVPEIDYLLLSHDHYDHLNYPTIKQLRPKVKHVICGLGVGSHLEYWGYNPGIITEKDWYGSLDLTNNLRLHILPARHFSGRTFKRNCTLWVSFLLETPNQKFFLGGDSGYGVHFKEIGQQFSPIDLAILENGQYHQAWRYIHCFPAETLQAGKDLNARRIMPVHNSKFVLSNHAWYEPMEEISRLNNGQQHLITPQIGEVVNLHDTAQIFGQWWKMNSRSLINRESGI